MLFVCVCARVCAGWLVGWLVVGWLVCLCHAITVPTTTNTKMRSNGDNNRNDNSTTLTRPRGRYATKASIAKGRATDNITRNIVDRNDMNDNAMLD